MKIKSLVVFIMLIINTSSFAAINSTVGSTQFVKGAAGCEVHEGSASWISTYGTQYASYSAISLKLVEVILFPNAGVDWSATTGPTSRWVSPTTYVEALGQDPVNKYWKRNQYNYQLVFTAPIDVDGDGFSVCEDSNDNNAAIHLPDTDGDGVEDIVDPFPNRPSAGNHYYIAKAAYDAAGNPVYLEAWVSNEFGEITDVIDIGSKEKYNLMKNGQLDGSITENVPTQNPFKDQYATTLDSNGLSTLLSTNLNGAKAELGLSAPSAQTSGAQSPTATTNNLSAPQTAATDPGSTSATEAKDYSGQNNTLIANQGKQITQANDANSLLKKIAENTLRDSIGGVISLTGNNKETGTGITGDLDNSGVKDTDEAAAGSYIDVPAKVDEKEMDYSGADTAIGALDSTSLVRQFRAMGWNLSGAKSTLDFTLPSSFGGGKVIVDLGQYDDIWRQIGNLLYSLACIAVLFYMFRS